MQINTKSSFATLCTLLALFSYTNASAVDVVGAISGNCYKSVMKAANNALPPVGDDFEFQGFGDISTDGDNVFYVNYSFNEECISGINVTIHPLKVIQKGHILQATECRIVEAIDGEPDCG